MLLLIDEAAGRAEATGRGIPNAGTQGCAESARLAVDALLAAESSLIVDPATHRIFVAYFGSIAVYEPISQP